MRDTQIGDLWRYNNHLTGITYGIVVETPSESQYYYRIRWLHDYWSWSVAAYLKDDLYFLDELTNLTRQSIWLTKSEIF